MKDKHPKGIICLPDYKDCRKADKTECAKKFSFVLIPDPVSCHLHIHCKHTCYAKHKYRSSTRVEQLELYGGVIHRDKLRAIYLLL